MLLFAVAFNACKYDNVEDLLAELICDTTAVSYTADVEPILVSRCYICHDLANGESAGGGYILEGYADLTASTDGSTLIDVIDWLPGGASDMPKNGSQLPSCERAIIRAWVNQGMLDN